MTIKIGFSRAKDWWKIGSEVIQLAEKRSFSHCYVKYTCPITAIDLVAQASHGAVNIMNYELFQTSNIVVEEYSFEINVLQFAKLLTYINTMAGIPYSKVQIILLALKKLLHIEVNIHNKDEAFICSELAYRVCEILQILPDIEDQDYITPSDLNRMIKNRINK